MVLFINFFLNSKTIFPTILAFNFSHISGAVNKSFTASRITKCQLKLALISESCFWWLFLSGFKVGLRLLKQCTNNAQTTKFSIKKVYNECQKILSFCGGAIRKLKKSVARTINTFGPNKKFHKVMRVLNLKFIK